MSLTLLRKIAPLSFLTAFQQPVALGLADTSWGGLWGSPPPNVVSSSDTSWGVSPTAPTHEHRFVILGSAFPLVMTYLHETLETLFGKQACATTSTPGSKNGRREAGRANVYMENLVERINT